MYKPMNEQTLHFLLICDMLNLWWTFMLCMTSFHTNLDINIMNDFFMLVWIISFDLFHDMVEWEILQGQLDSFQSFGLNYVFGPIFWILHLLGFMVKIGFYMQFDKGGKILDNVL